MSDYNSGGSVPPLIPGDFTFKDTMVNDRLEAKSKLIVPKITGTGSVLLASPGLLVLDLSADKLVFYGSTGWHQVTSS